MVGFLAARLAEQRAKSDDQLIAATHALANLRALHERIIESMRSGVITTDLHGHIYSMNTAAEEITGYSARDLKGQQISLLFKHITELIEASLRASAVGEIIPRGESECSKPDGTRLHLGFSIVPLVAETGETTGLVVTFQDLTHIRALEEQSRRQDRLAAIGRVSAGIAHEIRNPLAAMRGSVQMLRADMDDDPNSGELMEIVLRESDRLNRIITDFLLYARPRPCEPTISDLRQPLREVMALLRNSPETHPEHVFVENLPSAPLMACFDAAQLRQVFWNLAKNALQAMPHGGTLSLSMTRTPAGHLQVSFVDTGCGIPSEQQEKMFEPFSSSKANGTGLGLSIVYQIVQDHGGQINVRSREGAGTAISLELPAGNVAPDSTDATARKEPAPLYG
ncbi:MAG: ATP-binding protein [Pyrinomonadaceae bacterium]